MTSTTRPKIGLLALTLELYETLVPGLRGSREAWLRQAVIPGLQASCDVLVRGGRLSARYDREGDRQIRSGWRGRGIGRLPHLCSESTGASWPVPDPFADRHLEHAAAGAGERVVLCGGDDRQPWCAWHAGSGECPDSGGDTISLCDQPSRRSGGAGGADRLLCSGLCGPVVCGRLASVCWDIRFRAWGISRSIRRTWRPRWDVPGCTCRSRNTSSDRRRPLTPT